MNIKTYLPTSILILSADIYLRFREFGLLSERSQRSVLRDSPARYNHMGAGPVKQIRQNIINGPKLTGAL